MQTKIQPAGPPDHLVIASQKPFRSRMQSAGDVQGIFRRKIADSLQLVCHAPDGRDWFDPNCAEPYQPDNLHTTGGKWAKVAFILVHERPDQFHLAAGLLEYLLAGQRLTMNSGLPLIVEPALKAVVIEVEPSHRSRSWEDTNNKRKPTATRLSAVARRATADVALPPLVPRVAAG